MDKVFLDANVVFSAAYSPNSRLLDLWLLDDVELVISLLVMEEARRNMLVHNPNGMHALDELAAKITMVSGTRTRGLPEGIQLADKDTPILLAAIDSGCTHFLTGDKRHFETMYGKSIGGVTVLTPAMYLQSRII